MAANVLDTIRNAFEPDITGKSAQFLGESETGVQKAWFAIVPAVLAGIVNKVNAGFGKQEVNAIAMKHADSVNKSADQIFATNDPAADHNSTLETIFGNQLGSLVNIISSYAAIKTSSVQSLMKYAATEAFSQLGRYAREHNLDSNGFAAYLNNHKGPIMNIVPTGLDLSPVFGNVIDDAPVMEHGRGTHANDSTSRHKRPAMKTTSWLVPLVLLTFISIAALYFTRNSFADPGDTHASAETPDKSHTDPNAAVAEGILDSTDIPGPNSKGSLDSMGNYIYNAGTPNSINIGSSGNIIQAGANSTEARLINFLNDNTQVIDSVKGNWFEFTGVTFKTGSADLTSSSVTQLQNFALIAKAYPKARFKIGGYTDNRDDIKINTIISNQRAQSVHAKLIELGVAPGQLVGAEGYGPLHPVADNNTDEGRAMNRRVAVRVRAK